MGIRQTIQEKPQVTLAIVGGIIVIALISIFLQLKPVSPPKPPTKGFFTDDDGASYFKDDITNLAPFDHGGKPAVRAIVIAGNNGKTFVSSLLKFSERKRSVLEAMMAKNPADPAVKFELINGLDQIKKPLSPSAPWVVFDSQAGVATATFTVPPGVTQPTQVLEP